MGGGGSRARGVGVGKGCGRIPGRTTRRDLPDARSPALQPAPALIGARGRPPASSPAPPSQSGPPELGLSRGAGGDAACWRLSGPPRRVPAGPAPISRPSGRLRSLRPLRAALPTPRAFRRRVPAPAAPRLRWPGRAPTEPGATGRRRLPAAFCRAPALARSPSVCAGPGERVGRARGSPAEAGCSRPSPTRCRPRRLWSRLTRTRWTSAPKCSSTVCCGSGPSGGRRPSGPGGECAFRAG